MQPTITILGYGPVGQATTALLIEQGQTVVVAQRHCPAALPAGATFRRCDLLDADSVTAAIAGADQVVLAAGFAYQTAVWRRQWPAAIDHLLAACAAGGARLVFVDNLYMYGPQRLPLIETMPLVTSGGKALVRAEVTRRWQAAAGQVRVAALRAPDFYGPNVGQSHLGDIALGALAAGRRVTLIAPPDTPHDFAYVPDIARAVVTLLAAGDDAYGQAWHVPCAPTRTPRQLLTLAAAALGQRLRLSALPLGLLPALGVVSPLLRELSEMRFQWDRPYLVDAGKFARRFWADATPFESGIAATAQSFRPLAVP
jgi:nucleoside-diphosphate-sugar epimerase